MIKSMTGYGAIETVTDKYALKVEIKSLNSKFLDLTLKLPKEFSDKELDIKSLVGAKLVRGKVNFTLDFVPGVSNETAASVDEELFLHYFGVFKKLAERTHAAESELFKLALHAPNVIMPNEDMDEVITWDALKAGIEEALAKCDEFRKTEGTQLQAALVDNIRVIRAGLDKIAEMDPNRISHVRKRLDRNLDEIKDKVKVDENRFEQEVIYYLEKLDITEEKTRLASHLKYFIEVMEGTDTNGKKLGFISQEIGREINTIGSKANDAEMQRIVVGMKDALEQIKEQVLNVM